MALLRHKCETELYRLYVTDSLYYQARGMALCNRYAEIIHPSPDYDADEVVADVASRAGLEVI